MPAFKTYCWSIGNTSFRVRGLNYKNELQLRTLEKLFKENPKMKWGPSLEAIYYDMLTEVGMVEGTAPNKAKDAREITSALADLGLVDRSTRNITEVGNEINIMSNLGDYSDDNVFEIDKDSYLYLRQLLKFQVDIDQIHIRPFVSLLYMLIHLGYLDRDEFTYCFPICKNFSEIKKMTEDILEFRASKMSINKILLNKMFEMENYIEAYNILMDTDVVDEDVMSQIGMNRKSGNYDKPFAAIYSDLIDLALNEDKLSINDKIQKVKKLKDDLQKVNKNQASSWKKMFELQNSTKITEDFITKFYKHTLMKRKKEKEFKECFFKIWHLMKWKSTLEDYYDLNKRYINLTDIIQYSNSKFELTEIAKFYFSDIIDIIAARPLLDQTLYKDFYTKNLNIEEIYDECVITKNDIVKKINEAHGISLAPSQLNQYILDEKNKSFVSMIDKKFNSDILLELLDCFKNRNDSRIKELVSDEATPSTSFEYILGIIWYNISGRVGSLLDYMNLSLDVNMLPKTHAAGGDADLIFKYEASSKHPKHDLLIEATLSESTGQRHMEWEPVCRHLENHIKQITHNENDYVLFVAGNLDERTVKTFRTQKFYPFNDENKEYDGLKIIPVDTDILKRIICKKLCYGDLYNSFESAYKSDLRTMQWYTNEIQLKI